MEAREHLVQAGVELLERDGLANLTLRAIARQAGVTHGAPRHHFPTFNGLLAAIARTGVEDLDQDLRPALELPDPHQALHSASQFYVQFAIARPEMFELIARHDLLDDAGGNLRSITGRWMMLIDQRVREVDSTSSNAVALALWSAIHGLATIASRRTAEGATETVPDVVEIGTLLLERLIRPTESDREKPMER